MVVSQGGLEHYCSGLVFDHLLNNLFIDEETEESSLYRKVDSWPRPNL